MAVPPFEALYYAAMRRFLLIAFLLLCGSGAEAQPVHFPGVTVGSSSAGPEISGWLYRPSGEGPFPALVLAHTCAGVNEHTDFWGKRLAGWGYVVVAPDSFGPRGEKSVCGRGMAVSGGMRVADIAGAIDFLKAQPFVQPDRIGLIGHSHGGWATMRAVQESYGLAERGLKAAVAYYPSCSAAFDRNVAVPLLILIGEKDDWTPAGDCHRLESVGFERPDLVEAVYYPNAFHSFDYAARDRFITVAGGKSHHLAYDRVAADDAEARTKAFFDKLLRH